MSSWEPDYEAEGKTVASEKTQIEFLKKCVFDWEKKYEKCAVDLRKVTEEFRDYKSREWQKKKMTAEEIADVLKHIELNNFINLEEASRQIAYRL